ncbi:MAG: ABC transporter substrate-binding protein [Lachnospiraceae bacterium]|nr:ABC transporter substrate-binding protein [Lachnospiraceae bacterium]
MSKKKWKKVLAIMLGTAMATSTATGFSVSAAEESSDIDISEYVELKMYLVGDKPDGFDDVYAEINEILEEELNCSISVDWLSWAEHGTKYSLLFSSGEEFDLIFTASSWCHFEQTVSLGGFMALDEEFIQTYAPDIWEMMPEEAWKQATVNDSIYMVPANYVEVTPDVVAIRGDLMKEYGYEDISSWDDLISFYRDCASNGMYGNAVGAGSLYWLWFEQMGYDVVSGTPSDGEIILYNTQDPGNISVQYVVNWDEFAEYCYLAKELADAGCWPSDVLNSTYDRQDGLLNGTGASMVWNAGSCQTYANQANSENPDWNINIYNIMPDIEYTATKYINGGIGININSQNPERAMMVLNAFATNSEIQDLAQLGIEGVNWEAIGDDQYQVIEGASYDGSNYWGWRNQEIMRTEYNANPTAVDTKVDELNDYFLANVAEDHPLNGFSFDSSAVSTQYAAVEAAMGSYFDPLVNGLVSDVDATLEQFSAAMEAAGIQDILDELQSQIDEFVAENN